jgi:hypothetical protein
MTFLRDLEPLISGFSARRSRTPSMAKCAWLAPKPRKAPAMGLFVRTAIASTSTAGTWKGPVACPAARSRTFMPTEAYAPESPTILALTAVSFPSASHPAQYSMRIGCLLGCMRKDSSRLRVHFTGFRRSNAASAVCAWFERSSFPPKAPPFETSSASIVSGGTPSTDAVWLRSSQMPWPPE